MFAKDKVTQSMLDAVNAVIGEAEKKATGKKPGWLIDAEKAAEAREGKLKEDAEQIDEIDANAILAMAKKVSPTAKMRASSDEMKKDRDEKSAKQDAPKPHVPKSTFGDTKGYGQGRYMGDSVEVTDELVESKDQRFIDAVSKVINGGKGVTVEEESLQEKNWIKGAIKHPGALTAAAKKAGESNSEYEQQHKHDSGKAGKRARLALTLKKMHHEEVALDEKDELRDRIGTNIVNKKPREGQTDLRNIPAGNRPDGKNKFSQGERDSQPSRLKNSIKASLGKHSKPNLPEEVEQMDEVENAFTAYKNKRPSEIGRHLTRTHDSKRLSDTSVIYTKKHGKDLDSAKDAAKDAETAHNATVFAKKKMNKEDAGLGDNGTNEEVAFEARDWVVKDPKTGADKAWGHESDWRPVAKPKAQGSGKASNLAGKALQKTKQMTKEDTGLDTPVPTKPKTTDTLAGRIKVPKNFHNQHVDSKVELKAEEAHPDAAEDKKLISKMIKKDDEKEERKDKQKDVKLIKGLIKKDDARMKKEETEFEHIHGEHLKVHSGPHKGAEGVLHDIHGHIFEVKPHGAKSEKEHIYVPQNHTTIVHQHDEEYIPEAFHGPEAGSGTGDSPMATNDSKPVKLAKYLAVKTADKMKNEMLGKMTN